jgi:hypothetical protein
VGLIPPLFIHLFSPVRVWHPKPQKSIVDAEPQEKSKAITLEITGGAAGNTITFKKTITMELAGQIISLCCNGRDS